MAITRMLEVLKITLVTFSRHDSSTRQRYVVFEARPSAYESVMFSTSSDVVRVMTPYRFSLLTTQGADEQVREYQDLTRCVCGADRPVLLVDDLLRLFSCWTVKPD